MQPTCEYPIAILIRGLPGSGKSYLAAELYKTLDQDQVILLDPDTIDFESQAYADHVAACKAEGVDEKLWPYRFLRAQAYAGIEAHKVIIWNQPFTNMEIFEKMCARLLDHAKANDTTLPIVVVEVEIDPETARQRVKDRKTAGGHGPSSNTFDRFVREYDTALSYGYTVVTVQGNDNASNSVSVIMDTIADFS